MWAPFARLILDGAVASWASHDATQASVTYQGRVLEWDPIERSIPATAGLAQHSNTRIKVADTDRVVRDLMASYTFRRRTCKIYLAQGGQHPTEVGTPILSSEPVFTGEVFKMAFGENWVELYLRDTLFGWMDEEFPPLITPELFPTFPITEAIFAPILQGHLVAADGQGKVPLTHIGLIGSPPVDRWALACHDVFQVIAVYRKEPGDGVFTIVPQGSPPAWTVTTSTQTVYGLAVDFNFLDFTSVQVDGTEIAVDVDGIDFRGGWGPLSAVSSTSLSPPGPLRNPVDFFINMTYFFLVKAGRADISEIFDTTSIANLRDRCEPAGDNYTLCDGAELRPMTARQFIGKFLTSFEFFCHQQQSTVNNPGTITMGILSDSMAGPSFVEVGNIIRGTFREEVGDPSFNELLVKYGENYRLNAFETQQLIVNTLEQGQLGIIEGSPPALEPKSERDTVVLPYVTDAATAEISILRRMSFISYGSYRQFFDLPLPGLATVLEPGKSAYITHRMGIPVGGYNAEEVKILGVSLDLGQLKASVRTILPNPFNICQPASVDLPPATNFIFNTQCNAADETNIYCGGETYNDPAGTGVVDGGKIYVINKSTMVVDDIIAGGSGADTIKILASSGSYIYAYIHDEVGSGTTWKLRRYLKSNPATFDTITIQTGVGQLNFFGQGPNLIQGNFLYLPSVTNSTESPANPQFKLYKINLSTFAVASTLTFIPESPDADTATPYGIWVDSDYIYFVGAKATATYRGHAILYRISVASFTVTDFITELVTSSTSVSVGAGGLGAPVANDTHLYLGYSTDAVPTRGILRIPKSTFTVAQHAGNTLSINRQGMSADSMYLYSLRAVGATSRLVRFPEDDVAQASMEDGQDLDTAQFATFYIHRKREELFITELGNGTVSDPDQERHECVFIPA